MTEKAKPLTDDPTYAEAVSLAKTAIQRLGNDFPEHSPPHDRDKWQLATALVDADACYKEARVNLKRWQNDYYRMNAMYEYADKQRSEYAATIDALTPPPAEARQPWAPTRAEVAKIIDPAAWHASALEDYAHDQTGLEMRRDNACRKADLILALSPQVTPPAEQMTEQWQPIHTIPECDDLMWFCRRDAYEGPRAMHGDEADYFDWWCYANPPPLPAYPPTATENGTTPHTGGKD